MFKYKSSQESLFEERKKNEQLQAQTLKQRADIDYLAMMSDVELESDEFTEVSENE